MMVLSAFRNSAAFCAAVFLLANQVSAQEVRIIAKDGSLDLQGQLLSSDAGQLRLRTPIGEITVSQSAVVCEGAACPRPKEFDYAFTLAGPGDVAEVLIPILFDGFASENDAEIVALDATGFPIEEDEMSSALGQGTRIPLQMVDYDGEEVANFGLLQTSEGSGLNLLATEEAAVVFTDRPASAADIEAVAQSGGGNLASFEQEHVVAVEGLAVIAHPDNPIEEISVQDVAAIFAGQITNWSQVGGPNGRINVYSFSPTSGNIDDIQDFLLRPFNYNLTSFANIVNSNRELTAAVSEDRFGIAAIGYHNKRDTRAIPLSNECGMIIEASPFTIKNEEYPLEKRIVAYSRTNIQDTARGFLDHLDDADLDGLVSKAGFIDLSIVEEDLSRTEERMRAIRLAPAFATERVASEAIISELAGTQRLSTTFRFAPGSSLLDNRARRDIARMVDYVARNQPETLYIAGFADSAGPFSENQRLSEERARQVADLLSEAARNGELENTRIEVRGYSELAPVACNTTFEGRAINRRVEIWQR